MSEFHCKWCSTDEPSVLDQDGVQVAISGQPGLWAHAYEDSWWPCTRKAAEEHAEIERLREIVGLLPVQTILNMCQRIEDVEKTVEHGRRTCQVMGDESITECLSALYDCKVAAKAAVESEVSDD